MVTPRRPYVIQKHCSQQSRSPSPAHVSKYYFKRKGKKGRGQIATSKENDKPGGGALTPSWSHAHWGFSGPAENSHRIKQNHEMGNRRASGRALEAKKIPPRYPKERGCGVRPARAPRGERSMGRGTRGGGQVAHRPKSSPPLQEGGAGRWPRRLPSPAGLGSGSALPSHFPSPRPHSCALFLEPGEAGHPLGFLPTGCASAKLLSREPRALKGSKSYVKA